MPDSDSTSWTFGEIVSRAISRAPRLAASFLASSFSGWRPSLTAAPPPSTATSTTTAARVAATSPSRRPRISSAAIRSMKTADG
ncbi:MAG: hypothetical protein BGO11_02435 [Solirubrobacterales bacterium 70-9]|nr:MAG: hypothetical protein BGO11_02435 [Solirubrobacterales bacterium 70-9]